MTARARILRVHVVRTARTDLVCIACGGFRTHFEIVTGGLEAVAGVHQGCLGAVHVRRAAPKKSAVAAETLSVDDNNEPKEGCGT